MHQSELERLFRECTFKLNVNYGHAHQIEQRLSRHDEIYSDKYEKSKAFSGSSLPIIDLLAEPPEIHMSGTFRLDGEEYFKYSSELTFKYMEFLILQSYEAVQSFIKYSISYHYSSLNNAFEYNGVRAITYDELKLFLNKKRISYPYLDYLIEVVPNFEEKCKTYDFDYMEWFKNITLSRNIITHNYGRFESKDYKKLKGTFEKYMIFEGKPDYNLIRFNRGLLCLNLQYFGDFTYLIFQVLSMELKLNSKIYGTEIQ